MLRNQRTAARRLERLESLHAEMSVLCREECAVPGRGAEWKMGRSEVGNGFAMRCCAVERGSRRFTKPSSFQGLFQRGYICLVTGTNESNSGPVHMIYMRSIYLHMLLDSDCLDHKGHDERVIPVTSAEPWFTTTPATRSYLLHSQQEYGEKAFEVLPRADFLHDQRDSMFVVQ